MRYFSACTLALIILVSAACSNEAGPVAGSGGAAAEWVAQLAEISQREGINTTESGLMYQVLKSGTGPTPNRTDTVTTHYHGTLLDGTVFDSSYERGKPASFPLNRVIKGWTEALSMMPVGSKWRLYLPPELAYGKRGAPPKIGPNAALVFEVELLSIDG